jgi:hypothetical protein
LPERHRVQPRLDLDLSADERAALQVAVAAARLSEGRFGLDQGMIVLMVENFRSGLPWRLLRGSAAIRTGLHRAGFRGGWLAEEALP